jgi:hypothetical protein
LPGDTFFTDKPYTSAAVAQAELALKSRPDLQVAFRMTHPVRYERYGLPAEPKYGHPGGGIEYSTKDPVLVDRRNLSVTYLK